MLLGMHPEEEIELETAALELMRRSKARCVIITAGEQGIVGVDADQRWQARPPNVMVKTPAVREMFFARL